MYKIINKFPELKPYSSDIDLRMNHYNNKRNEIFAGGSILDFANAHKWYGFHKTNECWIYREWAPGADMLYLTGDFNSWKWTDTPLTKLENGDWEIKLPLDIFNNGNKVLTIVKNGEKLTSHIPLYAKRVIQDHTNYSWCCEVIEDSSFPWTDKGFKSDEPLLIYEAHVGMCGETQIVETYKTFADNILPHVKYLGYNTIQLMAIMEHPYYGSFGYQVSNFFAPSSRFGYPDELRYLINKAHNMGIRVLLDVVHSHAVKNTLEGINMFDGTEYQFFHSGDKGNHPAWGTKLFNYDKPEVLHFLLSNLKYWMEEFHFDGFRFDGVTSMLYHDHALGSNFSDLKMYFNMNTDLEALTYLQLANELIHQVNKDAITIAEDMSGMPGMCEKINDGGIGFDYRLGMGIPDLWIKLIKEQKDEYWNLGNIWHELTNRNANTIAYCESHDQALVGDKTIIFRLADSAMYDQMQKDTHTPIIDRAIALHKMIRLLTMSAGGTGYLDFMGNEFGHPEWIDFPREGNNYSYLYCRRQWSLLFNPDLKYQCLNDFDRDMIHTASFYKIFNETYPNIKWIHEDDKVLAYERGGLLFVFNFSPTNDYQNYSIPVSKAEDYQVLFSSDDYIYAGFGRIARLNHSAFTPGMEGNFIKLYMPSRTCIVLCPISLLNKNN